MQLTRTQQRIYDGLREDPAEFGDATNGLDVAALGAWQWLRCVLAGVSARYMATRWPLQPSATERADALEAAKRALLCRYAPSESW